MLLCFSVFLFFLFKSGYDRLFNLLSCKGAESNSLSQALQLEPTRFEQTNNSRAQADCARLLFVLYWIGLGENWILRHRQAWKKCLFPCKLGKISLQYDNISQHFLCISLFISLQITKCPCKEIPDLPFFFPGLAIGHDHVCVTTLIVLKS